MAEIVIKGMAAFQAKLREMSFSLQRDALIEVAKEGAQIVVDAAKAGAPRDTGALAEGIAMRVSNKQSDLFEATVNVTWSRKQFYGRFLEFGTKHITVRSFLGPAFESNRDRIADAMKSAMERIISRVTQ